MILDSVRPNVAPALLEPVQQAGYCDSPQNIAWDLFSIICFPVGLYRASSYLIGKHIVPLVMLPSTLDPTPVISSLEGFETVKIPTRGGFALDGVKVLARTQQKWMIFSLEIADFMKTIFPF